MAIKKKYFIICNLIFIFCFTSCLSTNVRSTGIKLPQEPTLTINDNLNIQISHNCSGDRCTGFSAKFKNKLNENINIILKDSFLTRAGMKLNLETTDKNLTIKANDTLNIDFFTTSSANKKPMSYVRTSEVWCSLKVDPQCKNMRKISEIESQCSGFASYYYQYYTSAGGWINISFAVKASSWNDSALIVTESPTIIKNHPPVNLSQMSEAPNWISNGGEIVFYKIECDKLCNCKDITKKKDFQIDERFLPINK